MFALGDSDDDDDDKPATKANLDEQIQQCLKAIEAEVRATDLVSCCHRRCCCHPLSLCVRLPVLFERVRFLVVVLRSSCKRIHSNLRCVSRVRRLRIESRFFEIHVHVCLAEVLENSFSRDRNLCVIMHIFKFYHFKSHVILQLIMQLKALGILQPLTHYATESNNYCLK